MAGETLANVTSNFISDLCKKGEKLEQRPCSGLVILG